MESGPSWVQALHCLNLCGRPNPFTRYQSLPEAEIVNQRLYNQPQTQPPSTKPPHRADALDVGLGRVPSSSTAMHLPRGFYAGFSSMYQYQDHNAVGITRNNTSKEL